MKRTTHTFCTHCGSKLNGELVGAEKFKTYFMGDCFTPYTHTRFNRENGLRQYVMRYVCPLKKFVISPHDDFMEEELILKQE